MAKATFPFFCAVVLTFLFTNLDAVRPGGKHVITKSSVYYTKQSTKVVAKKFRTTCTKTGFWLARRIRCRNLYYTTYELAYKTVAKYRTIYVCKYGYKDVYGKCEPDCGFGCYNGGSCTGPGTCSCRSGWTGNKCRSADCGSGCKNGGTCTGPGTCSCRSDWTGSRCQYAECDSGCKNGGSCTAPNTCSCRNGWTGDRCQNVVESNSEGKSKNVANTKASESGNNDDKKGAYAVIPIAIIIIAIVWYVRRKKKLGSRSHNQPPPPYTAENPKHC